MGCGVCGVCTVLRGSRRPGLRGRRQRAGRSRAPPGRGEPGAAGRLRGRRGGGAAGPGLRGSGLHGAACRRGAAGRGGGGGRRGLRTQVPGSHSRSRRASLGRRREARSPARAGSAAAAVVAAARPRPAPAAAGEARARAAAPAPPPGPRPGPSRAARAMRSCFCVRRSRDPPPPQRGTVKCGRAGGRARAPGRGAGGRAGGASGRRPAGSVPGPRGDRPCGRCPALRRGSPSARPRSAGGGGSGPRAQRPGPGRREGGRGGGSPEPGPAPPADRGLTARPGVRLPGVTWAQPGSHLSLGRRLGCGSCDRAPGARAPVCTVGAGWAPQTRGAPRGAPHGAPAPVRLRARGWDPSYGLARGGGDPRSPRQARGGRQTLGIFVLFVFPKSAVTLCSLPLGRPGRGGAEEATRGGRQMAVAPSPLPAPIKKQRPLRFFCHKSRQQAGASSAAFVSGGSFSVESHCAFPDSWPGLISFERGARTSYQLHQRS